MKVNNKERVEKMSASKYKEIFGVEKHIFDRLLRLLETADAYQRKSATGKKSRRHGIRMTILCSLHNMDLGIA